MKLRQLIAISQAYANQQHAQAKADFYRSSESQTPIDTTNPVTEKTRTKKARKTYGQKNK